MFMTREVHNLQPVLCNTGCKRCILTSQFQHLDTIKFIMDFYDNDVNWNKNLYYVNTTICMFLCRFQRWQSAQEPGCHRHRQWYWWSDGWSHTGQSRKESAGAGATWPGRRLLPHLHRERLWVWCRWEIFYDWHISITLFKELLHFPEQSFGESLEIHANSLNYIKNNWHRKNNDTTKAIGWW